MADGDTDFLLGQYVDKIKQSGQNPGKFSLGGQTPAQLPPSPAPQTPPTPGVPTNAQGIYPIQMTAPGSAQAQVPQMPAAPNQPGATQGGVMGFLNNPLVMGLLTGYLNAIRTPRYQGRGALIANAGLGALTGFGEAEKAQGEAEKSALEIQKAQLANQAELSKQQSLARIHSGKGDIADFAAYGMTDFAVKSLTMQQNVLQNKNQGDIFMQLHPGDHTAALLAKSIENNVSAVIGADDLEKQYQTVKMDPVALEAAILDNKNKGLESEKRGLDIKLEKGTMGGDIAEAQRKVQKQKDYMSLPPEERKLADFPELAAAESKPFETWGDPSNPSDRGPIRQGEKPGPEHPNWVKLSDKMLETPTAKEDIEAQNKLIADYYLQYPVTIGAPWTYWTRPSLGEFAVRSGKNAMTGRNLPEGPWSRKKIEDAKKQGLTIEPDGSVYNPKTGKYQEYREE